MLNYLNGKDNADKEEETTDATEGKEMQESFRRCRIQVISFPRTDLHWKRYNQHRSLQSTNTLH